MDGGQQQTALEQARDGDAQALGALLDSFRPYVRCLVRALGGEQQQPRLGESDLIQDALLEAHRRFAQFRGDTVAELTAWLRQIVLRTAGPALRNHLTSGKNDPAPDEVVAQLPTRADASPSPSLHASRQEHAVQIAQAIGRLPDEMQQVLLGRHLDGLAYAELAQRLGHNEGAVRVLYTRALRRLREE